MYSASSICLLLAGRYMLHAQFLEVTKSARNFVIQSTVGSSPGFGM
jgi:hypothetical protein